MLIPRNIDSDAFAAMPAFAADGEALRRLPALSGIDRREINARMVADYVRERTGITIVGPMHYWLRCQLGGRAALVVFHRYSAPATGEAQAVVCSERFIWTRKHFLDLAIVCIDLGIDRVLLSIPCEAETLKDLAQRAGFRCDGTALTDDGRAYERWSLSAPNLLDVGASSRLKD